jgi:hypothetical protein
MQLTEKSYVITLKNKNYFGRHKEKKEKRKMLTPMTFSHSFYFSRSHDRRELAFFLLAEEEKGVREGCCCCCCFPSGLIKSRFVFYSSSSSLGFCLC